jgi:hypothetical protein
MRFQPAKDFLRDYHVSGRPLGGPMLILQGSNDTIVGTAGALAGYNATCSLNNVSVEYVSVVGQNHNPSLYASQRVWLQWIEDRFNGVEVQEGCSMRNLTSRFGNPQLPERFLVQHEPGWVTIFSETFVPVADQIFGLE